MIRWGKRTEPERSERFVFVVETVTQDRDGVVVLLAEAGERPAVRLRGWVKAVGILHGASVGDRFVLVPEGAEDR